MKRGPRSARGTLMALAAVAGLSLIVAAPALAAAGGGSAGFHGGGGGRGAGLYLIFQLLIRLAIFGHGLGLLIIVAVIVTWVLVSNVAPRARAARTSHESQGRAARGRTAERERRVELAAAEASEDDPEFAPDRVRSSAANLFADVQAAWSANDRARLRVLVAPGLLATWERRLDDFARRRWRNVVELQGPPRVAYIGLARGEDAGAGRVVVRVEATLRDYVVDAHGNRLRRDGRMSETVRTREFWTLGRRAGDGLPWVLESIEQGAEGAHALEDRIVATPWSDDQALRDEALIEGAGEDAVPTGTSIAEVADLSFDGDAHAAALDLSVADGRFAPHVLEVSARRAVAAWARGVDGDKRGLRELATPQAVETLAGGGAARLVVRGPKLERIRVTGLDAGATPPTMTVQPTITATRYLEDRDTAALLQGDPARRSTFEQRWTFALSDEPDHPWRLVGAEDVR